MVRVQHDDSLTSSGFDGSIMVLGLPLDAPKEVVYCRSFGLSIYSLGFRISVWYDFIVFRVISTVWIWEVLSCSQGLCGI